MTGYCLQKAVETWAQPDSTNDFTSVGYDYANAVQMAIEAASRQIDNFCGVPEDFFAPGGVEIQQEYQNGADIIIMAAYQTLPGWRVGGYDLLKLKYTPVLSVTKLEEETSAGTWTQRTEGSGNDYVATSEGVRFVNNTPNYGFKNVRVTYKTGYDKTPGIIENNICPRLAAIILQKILDAIIRVGASVEGISVNPAEEANLKGDLLTDDMKASLSQFKILDLGFS